MAASSEHRYGFRPHRSAHQAIKTISEGQRIKQDVEAFLKTLKLPINQEKSQVVPMRELCFLGYQFKGRHLILSPKSLQNFKHRMRE
jgi:hypothetical protein